MAIDLTDRIAGSLYGLLTGDAFGCPVEGWSPAMIRGEHGRLTDMVEASGWWRPCGLHSDDGQQALALCAALLESPDRPEETLARVLVDMLRAGPRGKGAFGLHRGTGGNFRRTVDALARGAEVHAAAQPSAGNGVAMMIAPVAWYWREDLEFLRGAVIRVARVKQRDLRGIAAAGAVAFVTSAALSVSSPGDIDHETLLDFTRSVEEAAAAQLDTRDHLRTFSDALGTALSALGRPLPEVLAGITEEASRSADRLCFPGSGYSVASVVTSVVMTLTSTSFEQAVTDTVNLGGDTDTTGAMVGAMAGALYGRGSIPPRWYELLAARDRFDGWVEALAERRRDPTAVSLLLELEAAWTAMLLEGRR